MKNVYNLFLVAFFTLIALASGIESTPEVSSSSPAEVVIRASDLYAAYQANEIAADELYKGKLIEVSGTIRDIGNDLMDEPYITLAGDDFIGDVQCFMSSKSEAAKFSKGQNVTVKGYCDGLFMNVLLQNSILVE